jgi:hypothetical protein
MIELYRRVLRGREDSRWGGERSLDDEVAEHCAVGPAITAFKMESQPARS